MDVQTCEKFGIDPLKYFVGESAYQMKLKPKKVNGFINKIKALLSPEYELISNDGWNSEKGKALKILLLSYCILNNEEEIRIHEGMKKNTKTK